MYGIERLEEKSGICAQADSCSETNTHKGYTSYYCVLQRLE